MPEDSDPFTLLSSQKSTFLTRQIRLLSTPLNISPSTSSTTLPSTLLDPLLSKLNKRITSHNRLSFPLESQRHVLEQVDGVYWRDVLSKGLPVGKSETVVGRDVDFTGAEEVRGLGRWGDVVVGEEERDSGGRARKRRRVGGMSDSLSHDGREHDEHDENEDSTSETTPNSSSTQSQPHRYQALQTRLTTSIERRNHLRQKLLALKRLKAKLEPFEDAQSQVQPNLMWKGNKKVESEIARMRVLLVKCRDVGRRVRGEETQGQIQTQIQRIESVLGLG